MLHTALISIICKDNARFLHAHLLYQHSSCLPQIKRRRKTANHFVCGACWKEYQGLNLCVGVWRACECIVGGGGGENKFSACGNLHDAERCL